MINNFIYITPTGTDLTVDYDSAVTISSIEIASMQYTDGLTTFIVTPSTPGYTVRFSFSLGGAIIEAKNAGRYDTRIDVSITDPNDANKTITGYFTSVWNDPNVSDAGIVNTTMFLTINRITGVVNPPETPFTHVYDGLCSPVPYTTTPPNISCYVTYSGSGLIPPIEVGTYTVTIAITDRNYKDSGTPFTTDYTVIYDAAATSRQLEERQALLDPEASSSLNSGSTSSFVTNALLTHLDIPLVKEMSSIGSIADCAKSLPDKLMKAITKKAISLLMSYIPGLGIVNLIKQITDLVGEVKQIIEKIEAIRKNPLGFLDSVLASQGVYASVNAQIKALEEKFPLMNDVAGVLQNIDKICNMQDYSSLGLPSPGLVKTDPTKLPTATTPTPMPQFNQTSNTAKMDYDALIGVGHLKDATAKDTVKMDELTKSGDKTAFSNYVSMITAVTTVIHSYHDDISKTTDASKDATLLQKYTDNVAKARTANPSWDAATLAEFDKRTLRGQSEISKKTDIIRAYFMKNTAVIGGVNSKGATTYSGMSRDFTTYLDVYPAERNAADTAYWQSRGYNTNKPWNSTLHASDASNGAYGPLISDKTIASCRWPGGSVIALKNPNGSPYDPVGKNPSGTYTVTDTGNSKLTYDKPDIYTDTPDLYKGLDTVESFVISLGTKTNSQYRLAQKNHPENSTNGAASNV